MFANRDQIREAFERVGRRLASSGVLEEYQILVCGGAALVFSGIIQRSTKDVDVLGILEGPAEKLAIRNADELPEELENAARIVGADLGLSPDWLNTGPSPVLRVLGPPVGILNRAESIQFGPCLRVFFAGRLDAIGLKLFAAVDRKEGARHLKDLEALQPKAKEILQSAKWLTDRPTSPAFRRALARLVTGIGFPLIARAILNKRAFPKTPEAKSKNAVARKTHPRKSASRKI